MKREVKFFSLACIAVAILSQLVVFASIIKRHETIRRRGAVLRFDIQPIDPFDAFRGQYVSLRFRETMNVPTTNQTGRYERGQRIYVRFAAGTNGMARPAEARRSEPDWHTGNWLKTRVRWANKTDVSFTFPIDRFYADEKAAPQIEELVSRRSSRGVVSNACAVARAYKGTFLLENLEFEGVPVLDYLAREDGKD